MRSGAPHLTHPIDIMKRTCISPFIALVLLASVLMTPLVKGLPAELPDPDGLAVNTNKPVKVFLLAGQSNMVGMGTIAGSAPGTLETLTREDNKFSHLVDAQTNWTVRSDVYFYEARIGFNGGPLAPGQNGKATIGPELQFGHLMGHLFDEQVLLIKTAQGNRSLGWDFRPPSSGNTSTQIWEGLEYDLMIEGFTNALENIDTLLPGYVGQGYEIAGFAWWQGHKDSGDAGHASGYETNLVNLIKDVRTDLGVPDLPAVVATVAFGGYALSSRFPEIHAGQLAVSGEKGNYPEFAGNVMTVDTRDFWRSVIESPRNEDFHYNRNAETYLLAGDALGRGMYALLEGTTAPPSPDAMTFSAEPESVDETTITMTASIGYDSSVVEYYFENTTNTTFRDWGTGRVWEEAGLTEGVPYGYRVKARDGEGNETGWSAVASAAPEANQDVLIFSEDFEDPVVSGYGGDGTVPAENWVGAITGFGFNRRGLYNEDTEDFSTPDGAQAYRLWYSNAGLTTTNDLGILVADRTYTVSFNVGTLGSSDLFRVKLMAFAPGDVRTSNAMGSLLNMGDGLATTNTMTQTHSFEFTADFDHPNLGQAIAIRLEGTTGNDILIDNIQLKTLTPPDFTPPTPTPMSFDTQPFALNATTVVMTATTAFDAHGSLPIEYYFENTSNAMIRGWSTDTVWTNNSGLTEGLTYGYRVRARDAVSNETAWSEIALVVAETDVTPPNPSPMTFALVPLGVDERSITMKASPGFDISNPIEYRFENTRNGNMRDWGADSNWTDTGLSLDTTYGYRVKARDALLNETDWSSVFQAAPVNTAGTIFYEGFESPVVEGYVQPSVPGAGWVGSTQGFNATRRGLYNEGDESTFSTPYGEQGYLLNYTNSGLTTDPNAITNRLTAGVTYTISFNAAVQVDDPASTYFVEFVTIATNANRAEARAQRAGTVLASAVGSVTTPDMLTSHSFSFTPESDDVSLGEPLAIRLIKASGNVLYDNVRLKVEGGSEEEAIYGLRMSDTGGQVQLEWDAVPGTSYWIEWSTDLSQWNKISVGEAGDWMDPDPQGEKRYYRISQ